MKLSPADIAKALFLAARPKNDKDAAKNVKRLIALLRGKRLLHLLPRVARQLPMVAARIEESEALRIETARPLSEEELARVGKAFGAGREGVGIMTAIVPELLGGIRLKRGGKVFDATVRGKLAALRAAIAGSADDR